MEELGRYLLGGSIGAAGIIAVVQWIRSTYMKDKEIRANLGGNLSALGSQKDLIDDLTEEAERWKTKLDIAEQEIKNERARVEEWQSKYYALLTQKGED
jgi:chaperonin cofactor prefoldin